MLQFIENFFKTLYDYCLEKKSIIIFYLLGVSVSIIYIIDILHLNIDYCGPLDTVCKMSFSTVNYLAVILLTSYITYCIVFGVIYDNNILVQSFAQMSLGFYLLGSLYFYDVISDMTLCMLQYKYVKPLVASTIGVMVSYYCILLLLLWYTLFN